MKTRNAFSILFLSTLFCSLTFLSCSEELTFSEKYQGDWQMTTQGAINGSYTFTIGSTPGEYQVTPYMISGDGIMDIEFDCTLTISETGSFSINLESNVLTHRGKFEGILDELGTGNGNFTIIAWHIASFSELPLQGNFTLKKD